MKPDVSTVMQGFFGTLLMDVAPHLNAEYSIGNASIMGLSLFMAAEEFDRAADIRVRENEAMRALFADAAGVVEDKALGVRLLDASNGGDTSLRLSALDAANEALKALLIELQIALEAAKDARAAVLEDRLWVFLIEASEARRLPIPSFG